tara:strand:- start:927 stop:1496 length:570 start_codon:yes stop_codon:yes gene_type:complete
MLKNKIRKSLLEQGQLFPNDFFSERDLKIQQIAISKIDIKSSINNLLYFPYKKEIKINLLVDTINKYSNNIYMPKIFPEKILKFNLFSKDSILKKNKYGIEEIENESYLDPLLFNTMFIPFVGVDKNGTRLGYGGGYFDRALEKINSSSHKPLIVGMGYDYQIVDDFFGEDHDIRYDIVITESHILSYS